MLQGGDPVAGAIVGKGTEVVPLAVPGGRSVQGVEGFLIAAILDVPVGGLSLGRVELRLLLALLPPPLAKDVLVGVTAIACAAGVGSAAVAGSAGLGGIFDLLIGCVDFLPSTY